MAARYPSDVEDGTEEDVDSTTRCPVSSSSSSMSREIATQDSHPGTSSAIENNNSFSYHSFMEVPTCEEVEEGWCGNFYCRRKHIFTLCKNYMNFEKCKMTNCKFMHISDTEYMEHRVTGIFTPTMSTEAFRIGKVANQCHKEGCTGIGCVRRHRFLEPKSVCKICYCNFVSWEIILNQACGHVFCLSCYSKFDRRDNDVKCPLCRSYGVGLFVGG